MAQRSAVLLLPDDVRAALDRKLVETGFSDYSSLASWLAEQGFEISRSAVHRYGQQFEDRLAALRVATAQAQAIVETMGDDAGAVGEALTAVAQQKAFEVLLKVQTEDQDVPFDRLLRGISQLNTSGVSQKKWALQVREKAQAAAADVDEMVRKAGLTDDVASAIRAKILGVI